MKAAISFSRVVLLIAFAMINAMLLHGGSWGPPTVLESGLGDAIYSAKITFDGDGNATTMWTDGDNVLTATKPYGAAWDPTEILQTPVFNLGDDVSLATNSAGFSIGVWLDQTNNDLYYSTRTYGSPWSAPAVVPVPLAFNMAVTVDPSGNATLIFLGTSTDIYGISLPFGGSWSLPTLISTESGLYNIDVAADGLGNVATIFGPSTSEVVYIAELPFGGSWGAPITMDTPTFNVYGVAIAADINGNFSAIWNPQSAGLPSIQAATKDFGGSWSAPVQLSTVSIEARAPNIAIDSGGNSVAAWQEEPLPSTSVVYTADRPTGGAWQTPFLVSDPNGPEATETTLDVNPDGYAAILFNNDLTNTPYAVRRPIQGAWSAPVEVSDALYTSSFENAVGVDPFNDTYAVFGEYDVDNLDACNTIPNPWVPPVIQSWSSIDDAVLVGDADGNTLNIWSDFITKDLFFREKIANGLWTNAASFASIVHSYLLTLDAYTNPTGYTLAYWTERDTTVGPNLQYLYAATQQFSGAWSGSTLLLTTTATTIPVNGVVDQLGNATIVYTDSAGGGTYYRTLPFEGSWGAPVLLTASALGAARDMVIDGSGNITFIVDSANEVVAYTLPFGGSWSGPVSVSGPTTAVLSIQAAANSGGDVEAVWNATVSGVNIIAASTHPFGGSWSSPAQLSTAAVASSSPNIGIDTAGNAVATWLELAGTDVLRGASKPDGGSWDPAVTISDGVNDASAPSLSMNGVGTVMALWAQSNTVRNTPRQSILNFGGTWSTPFEVEDLAAVFTSVFVDPLNNATAIWADTNGEFYQPLYASSRLLGPIVYGLSPPFGPIAGGTVVTITGAGFTGTTQVYFDGIPATSFIVVNDGTITAVSPPHAVGPVYVTVETDEGTSPDVEVGIFTYVTGPVVYGLSPPLGPTAGGTVVTITGASFTGTTQVYFDGIPATSFIVLDDGTITAVSPPHAVGPVFVTVQTPEGTSPEVEVGIFTYVDGDQPLPPESFSGKAGGDRFLTQTDLYNFLRWTPSPDPGVVIYRIYRDGDLLAEVSASSPSQYIDHNRRKKTTYVYTIVAVNGIGAVSTPLEVTLTTR